MNCWAAIIIIRTVHQHENLFMENDVLQQDLKISNYRVFICMWGKTIKNAQKLEGFLHI